MTLFKTYLEEAYGPIASLLQDESNRQKLMKLGVSKNSKLVRIPMPQATKNETDLILFANIFPTGEEKLGKVKMIAGLKKTKAREALAKKIDVPSTWIGYKKGEDFEVWRPVEAGGGKKKSCTTLDCLYDSDFAYKIENPRKEELKRKFREETPGRKEWIEGGRESEISGNLMYKMYRNKLISLLDKVIDNVNKLTISYFEEFFEKPIMAGKLKDSKYDTWSEYPNDKNSYISSILSKLSEIEKDKKKINKKNMETFISKIEKEIK